jgi:hypothetical protein
MGIHSTFFGPIKYAILPQHLGEDEVLGGTGLVEAGTYIAILGGTIFGGLLVLQRPDGSYHAEWAAVAVLFWCGRRPDLRRLCPARAAADDDGDSRPSEARNGLAHRPRFGDAGQRHLAHPAAVPGNPVDQLLLGDGRGSRRPVPAAGQEQPRLRPDRRHLFLAVFSIGVAIGSVVVNWLLKGKVSARFSPVSALVMGLFVLDLFRRVRAWPINAGDLHTIGQFIRCRTAGWWSSTCSEWRSPAECSSCRSTRSS